MFWSGHFSYYSSVGKWHHNIGCFCSAIRKRKIVLGYVVGPSQDCQILPRFQKKKPVDFDDELKIGDV